MPNYIAIEWSRKGIRGLDAEVTGADVQVRQSLSLAWPADLDATSDHVGVGRWLRSRIDELGSGSRKLIVLVSREDLTMRLLTLPEAGDEMLPDLVRHQTAARSSVPFDRIALDYLPFESAPADGGRLVQTFTVPDRLLQHIKACANVADLELCAIGSTTVAIGGAIARAEPVHEQDRQENCLVVRVCEQQLEIACWRGMDLLFSHVSRAASTSSVAAEVQRALMSHEELVGERGVERTWLLAPTAIEAPLRDELATRLNGDVSGFEPSRVASGISPTAKDAAEPATYVAALGGLLARGQGTLPAIDFLAPRRRVEKPNQTKVIAAAAGIAVLVLLLTGYLGVRWYLAALNEQIADRQQTVDDQNESWRRSESIRETDAFLSAWDRRRVDWLEEMRRIGAEMPGTERVYFERWRFDATTGEMLGTTEASGFARQRQDAERLSQRLAEQAGFRVRPNPHSIDESDPRYPILFQLDAELVARTRQSSHRENE